MLLRETHLNISLCKRWVIMFIFFQDIQQSWRNRLNIWPFLSYFDTEEERHKNLTSMTLLRMQQGQKDSWVSVAIFTDAKVLLSKSCTYVRENSKFFKECDLQGKKWKLFLQTVCQASSALYHHTSLKDYWQTRLPDTAPPSSSMADLSERCCEALSLEPFSSHQQKKGVSMTTQPTIR